MLLPVAGDTRLHVHEGVAAVLHVRRQRAGVLVHLLAVVDVARRDGHCRHEQAARHLGQLAVHAYLADLVALALVDDEGHEEAAPVGRQLARGARHLHVGVAVLKVEAPQQLLVELQALRVVLVRGRENAVERLLAARDHLAQAVLAVGVVAYEGDAADERRGSLVDLEHHVDAVVGQADDLRLDGRGVAGRRGILVENALAVGIGKLRREHRALAQLYRGPQLRVVELVVALEGDGVDDRVLGDVDHERVALTLEADILEQPRGVERLDAAVQALRVERVAGRYEHVGEDRPGLDALVAVDLDGADRALSGDAIRPRGCDPPRRLARTTARRLGASLCAARIDARERQQASRGEESGAGRRQAAFPPSGRRDHAAVTAIGVEAPPAKPAQFT